MGGPSYAACAVWFVPEWLRYQEQNCSCNLLAGDWLREPVDDGSTLRKMEKIISVVR